MLRIVPHTVPHVGRSCEHFPDGLELHLLTSLREDALGEAASGNNLPGFKDFKPKVQARI